MWAAASGRLPVIQLENLESAHFERLLTTAAVVQTTQKPFCEGQESARSGRSARFYIFLMPLQLG